MAARIGGIGPAAVVAVDHAPHDPQQARAGEAEARDVEAALGPVGLLEPQVGKDGRDDADRDVEQEDPVPAQPLGDGATHERADRDREPGDPAPRAEREGPSLRGNRGRQDRQAERRDDRATDALDGPGEDQDLAVRGEGGRERSGGEHDEADDEHPATAEAVTERGAGEQQHRERQRVGVDHPLELLERGAKVLADHGQRGGDDEVVEGDHEQADRADRERPGH